MASLLPQVVAFPDQEIQVPQRTESREFLQAIPQPFQVGTSMESAFPNQAFLNYAYIPQN